MLLNETVTSFLSFHPQLWFLAVLVFEFLLSRLKTLCSFVFWNSQFTQAALWAEGNFAFNQTSYVRVFTPLFTL